MLQHEHVWTHIALLDSRFLPFDALLLKVK